QQQQQRWSPQPLTPLMEGPDLGTEDSEGSKKESSWEVIREWFGIHRSGNEKTSCCSSPAAAMYGPAKSQDLRLLLGVLGCPLAPIPISREPLSGVHIRDIPIEASTAYYIIQQYLAATGCSKRGGGAKSMYAAGTVKLIRCETEISTGKSVRTIGSRSGDAGCFVLWQMSPAMWSLELAVAGNKVVAGGDGKIVWRHTPWLGAHAAKGPQRPLRRIIQGLDPRLTASLFEKAQCLGEKQIGGDECFVLKVAADRAAVMERNEGPAEVIRHVLYGYFSQRSGLLVYMEDSHLTRVHSAAENDDAVYWETTIGSSIGDYRGVDGVMIGHRGRTVATVFRFGETSAQHSRTRMEEIWKINDVVFNVPGLSVDSFIPPAEILE
ncbi:hypothetical protein M569_08266, partial [Genlisea aurea]